MVPSNIERPEGYQLILKEVNNGLYVAQNAYEGQYKYFLRNAPVDRRPGRSRVTQKIRVIHLSE